MGTICPKIFAKLDFFATMSQLSVAYSALKIFLVLLTQFLKFCKIEKKNTNLFRVKDNLAVLP